MSIPLTPNSTTYITGSVSINHHIHFNVGCRGLKDQVTRKVMGKKEV